MGVGADILQLVAPCCLANIARASATAAATGNQTEPEMDRETGPHPQPSAPQLPAAPIALPEPPSLSPISTPSYPASNSLPTPPDTLPNP